MSPRIEAESELRYYGSIELYEPPEPSIGTHCVAFLQLLYNEVKSPQDKPLDSHNHYIARYCFRRATRSLIVSLKAHFEDRMQSERRNAH